MTWQHPKNGTTISRCSQPLSGIRGARCYEDEYLIREIGLSTPGSGLYVEVSRFRFKLSNTITGKRICMC